MSNRTTPPDKRIFGYMQDILGNPRADETSPDGDIRNPRPGSESTQTTAARAALSGIVVSHLGVEIPSTQSFDEAAPTETPVDTNATQEDPVGFNEISWVND